MSHSPSRLKMASAPGAANAVPFVAHGGRR